LRILPLSPKIRLVKQNVICYTKKVILCRGGVVEEVKQGRLTKAEYVMGAADSLVNGLKAAMNIWSGLLLTVFLKFSPENYVTLSGYLVALEVVMIPLYYVLARITDRIKNIKRLAAIMYFPASIFPAILTLPMAYFFPGVSDTIKIVFVVSITFLQSAFGAMNSNAWRLLDIRLWNGSPGKETNVPTIL